MKSLTPAMQKRLTRLIAEYLGVRLIGFGLIIAICLIGGAGIGAGLLNCLVMEAVIRLEDRFDVDEEAGLNP